MCWKPGSGGRSAGVRVPSGRRRLAVGVAAAGVSVPPRAGGRDERAQRAHLRRAGTRRRHAACRRALQAWRRLGGTGAAPRLADDSVDAEEDEGHGEEADPPGAAREEERPRQQVGDVRSERDDEPGQQREPRVRRAAGADEALAAGRAGRDGGHDATVDAHVAVPVAEALQPAGQRGGPAAVLAGLPPAERGENGCERVFYC